MINQKTQGKKFSKDEKPKVESVDEIEHIDESKIKFVSAKKFLDFGIAPEDLEHIAKIPKDGDLITEAYKDALYKEQHIYTETRDEKARDTDHNEAIKSAKALISEIAFSQYTNGVRTEDTQKDYDFDVKSNGEKIDVKIVNVDTSAYNIPIRRYGYESVRESIEKKDRDYFIQGYDIEDEDYIYIGFHFAFNIDKALNEMYNPDEKDFDLFDWCMFDGKKTWRTICTKDGKNFHLFNRDTAINTDVSESIEQFK